MGVLNLTIDRAPTSPKDKAKEDLTTNITKKTILDHIGNTLPTFILPAIEFAYLM